jgi:hypothetical protein
MIASVRYLPILNGFPAFSSPEAGVCPWQPVSSQPRLSPITKKLFRLAGIRQARFVPELVPEDADDIGFAARDVALFESALLMGMWATPTQPEASA